jgi:hypothetical protein
MALTIIPKECYLVKNFTSFPHSLIHNSTKPNEKEPVLVSYQLLNISAGPGNGHLFKIFIPAKVLVFENLKKKTFIPTWPWYLFGPRLILGLYVAGTSQVLKLV